MHQGFATHSSKQKQACQSASDNAELNLEHTKFGVETRPPLIFGHVRTCLGRTTLADREHRFGIDILIPILWLLPIRSQHVGTLRTRVTFLLARRESSLQPGATLHVSTATRIQHSIRA